MSRNALDKMKKQGSAKAKQNRTKRRTESAKQYNRSQNQSDRAYIEGNYKKVASNKAYGYRQGLKKGEIVKGEDTDWLRDDKIYRNTKVKENTSWKNPTNNNGKQKYAILSSHKWDKAKKFDDHLNTKVWDGIKTAKANQRKGKHISNAFEYGKGLLKDIIVDPAVDTMKSLGAIGSYGTAGIAGFAEDSGNVFKAIADPKRDYKYYSQGRSNIKENLKMNKKSLDETGFGEDFSTYLKGAKQRGEEEHIRLLEEQGRHNEVREYKKQIEKNKKRDEILTNVAGFGMDILAPTPVEDGIVKVIGKLGKNTVKSFKELKNGTASLATGILPEETAKLMSNSKKYAGKGNKTTGASDDIFFSNKKGKSATDKLLDDDYKKTLLKETLKENKNTSKISRFLSKIDTKNVSRYSREMDEVSNIASDVVKNKKNATISSASKYEPVSSNHINDNVKSVIKDPELKKYGYDKGNRYYDDYDAEFFKEVDHWQNILDKDPDNRLKNIERMKKYNKEVYDYMQQSVDDSIGSFDAEKFLSDLKKKNEVPQNVSKSPKPTYSKEHHKDNKYWVGLGEEVNNTFDTSIKNIENINKTYNKFNKNVIEAKINNTELTKIPVKIKEGRKSLNSKVDRKSIKNIVNHDNVNTEIAIEKLVNIMEGSTPKTIANNSARKFEFGKDVSSLSQNILDGKFDIDNFKKIKDTIVGTNATKAQKIDYINNTLFGGKKVLTRSATKKSIDDFLNSIDEINEVKKVIDNFYETGEYLPISLSKSTREFLGISNNKQLKITDKKFAGKNIDNPEDIVTELTNALINKSGSLTDARYWEKQQLLANKYGYKKVQYVKDELDEITKTLKSLDKKQTTPDVLAQKQKLSMRRKQLKELLDNRQQDWDGILKSMNEVTFDDYIAKEHPDIMNKIDFYKQKNTNPNSFNVEKVSNQSNVNRVFDELLGETADANKGKRMNYADFVKEQYETMTLKDKALNSKQWQDELKRRWKEYNLELDGAVDERNIEYLRGEKMRNQIRDGASSVKNNNVGQNSRARQEMLDEVGEYVAPKYTTQELHKQRYDKKILNHQIDNIRKRYDLPKPKVNAKIKLQKGQKLKDLPPVKENLANLRKTIQKEIKYMFENPDKYKEFEGAFKQVKLDYVNSLRSIGVPDEKYFHKVVALQDELKGKMNKILEGGEKNTPLLKMELQKLANRVDETFNEFDNVVLDKIDDVNIKTFNDVVTDLNKANNPFDELLNKVDDIEDTPFNEFDDVDPSDFDSSIDIPTEEIDLMQELKDHNKNFFNSVEDIRNRKEIHKREEAKISKSMPKVSELFNNAIKSGMSKDEAMEFAKKTYEGMLKGDIKIPEIEFKLRKSNDGFVGYDRVGIKENISNTPLDKIDDTLPKSDNFKTNPPKTLEDIMKEEFEDNFAKDEKELYGRTLTKGEIKGNEEKLNRRFYKDNEVYDMYKAWLNSWKKGLTVYNPGWWGANFLQNKGQNYLALGADAFMPQTEAKNIIRKMKGRNYKDVNVFDSKNKISYSMDDIAKLAQEFGVIDGLGEDVRNARGIFPRLENKVDNSGFMKRLGEIEEIARMHHFVKQLEKGMSPEDASKSVNKYLFDYSKKNGVDDFMGDFIDPFWTFHKNNARLMYGSMYEHPGKINNIIRGTKGLENGIPEEQRQNEEYKYGKLQLPHANFTDSVNKDQYNYLYKQNMFPDVEDAIPFEQDAIENKMNPLLRIALQQARGEGNFGNKIVEKGEEAGWNEITMGQRLGEIVQDLNPFMPNLVNTYLQTKERQKKADEEKQSQETTDVQILMDWINYITGNKGNFYRNIDF